MDEQGQYVIHDATALDMGFMCEDESDMHVLMRQSVNKRQARHDCLFVKGSVLHMINVQCRGRTQVMSVKASHPQDI